MKSVAIVGGGPAGLMAAEVLSCAGASVDLFDRMPSVGRKFLLAGRGGLNLTHAEPTEKLLTRFGGRGRDLQDAVRAFDGPALRDWAQGLGIETFVGTSGRVFPAEMKAAPLLRAWLHRLRAGGVRFHSRHTWTGWDADGALRFDTPGGESLHTADATVLALGGASWPRLGSDGSWLPVLQGKGVEVAPLAPSNCGFDVTGWSEHLRERFAGQPVKPVVGRFTTDDGTVHEQQGEFVLTDTGIEGSLVYAFSAQLRDHIAKHGEATWQLDLLPQHSPEQVLAATSHPRGSRSLSQHLKSRLHVHGTKTALLYEVLQRDEMNDPKRLAAALKSLPIRLVKPRPVEEAISTAGGVRFESMDAQGMLRAMPGTFCAGEMLDWEAPTGGYLLTASMATGRWAAQGAVRWLTGSA